VKSFVGGADQFFPGAPMLVKYGDAGGERHRRQLVDFPSHRLRHHLAAQVLNAYLHIGQSDAGQYGEKFLSSVTADDILGTEVFLANRGEGLQHAVSHFMAEDVIHFLEMIEIEQDDSQRAMAARLAPQFTLQRLFHVAAVEEACERIADALFAQHLPHADTGERQRKMLGQCLCQPS